MPRNANAIVVLGSATPSIETRYNADQGRYAMLLLPERIAKRPMPKVQVIDMRARVSSRPSGKAPFRARLLEEMQTRLKNGRTDHAAAQPPRLFELHGLPPLR